MKLGVPLQRLQQETTSSEFVQWMQFLRQKHQEDLNGFHREDYHAAMIAAEVRRGWVADKTKVDDSLFLLKFKPKKKPRSKASKQAAKQKAFLKREQEFFGKWLGVDFDGGK